MNQGYEVCGYRDSLEDLVMYMRYCENFNPIPYDEWYKLTLSWMNKKTKKYPYFGRWPTSEESREIFSEEIKRIKYD